jgi:hypothetical protein
LTTGTDVDLGWDKLGANSLVTGLGNQATAPASLVSGTYNKIFDLNKSRVGGSAILGGVRNTLQFSYQVEDGRSGSTIIGSSGVFALNCSNSVFLGLRLAPGVAPFDGLDNTTVVQDLQTLGEARMGGDIRANGSVYCADIYALGAPSQGQTKTTADIGGTIYAKTLDVEDAQVTGDIFTTNIFAGIPTQQRLQAKASGGLFGQTLDVKEAKAEIAVYGGDIYAVGITPASNSSKLEGSSKPEGGFYGKTLNVEVATIGSNVTPTPVLIDSNLVIEGGNPGTYDVAPLNQNVTILLDSTQAGFVNGQTISFKDITQVFQPTTPFNVLISVNNDVYIETYDAIGQLQLVQNGTYTLNTTGGAVTLRYVAAPILGAKSSWVITNQFSGRDRQPI